MKAMLLTVGLILSSVAYGADDGEVLFGGSAQGGYVGLVGKSSQWGDATVSWLGFHAAWAVHDYVKLGLEAQTSASPLASQKDGTKDANVILYGLHGEGRLYDWRFLSLRATVTAGTGSASYRVRNETTAAYDYTENAVRYGEADLNVIAHLTEQADVGVGYGMLMVGDAKVPGYAKGGTSGSIASVFLRKRW